MADSLLSEVDADLRAEKLAIFWMRYRQPLAVFCVALVLATAAMQGWNHHRASRGAAWLNQLAQAQQALEKGKAEDAAAGFARVADVASGEARTIAQLWQARALLEANKPTDAKAILQQAVGGEPSLWTDLACLRLAALDTKAATCLGATASSPLQRQRQLWHAAQLQQQGDEAAARTLLSALAADDAAPPATRETAQQWLAILNVGP